MHQEIYNTFKNTDNTTWTDILCLTPKHPKINGVLFPGFPEPATQIGMVGSAYEQTLREVAALYREVHAYMQKTGKVFDEHTKVLDFGCGFGRILRFFMKDVAPGNLMGTDVDPGFIDICNQTFSGVTFDINAPYPPLSYPDATFDIIYAYSVFTHLAEEAHLAWLKEMRRITKPGGLIFLTLRQHSFLQQCNYLRTTSGISDYEKSIAAAFGDLETTLRQYVDGAYMYVPNGGGGVRTNDFYGDTVLPPAYIKKVWTEYFTIVDNFDDLRRMAQALIVLQPK